MTRFEAPKPEETCDFCGRRYRFGTHVYEGKWLERYQLNACNNCLGAADSPTAPTIAPAHEYKVLINCAKKGLAAPTRGPDGRIPALPDQFPRQFTQGSPTEILDALLHHHEGGQELVSLIKRVVLRIRAGMHLQEEQNDALDRFYGDLPVLCLALEMSGGNDPAARRLLIDSWAGVWDSLKGTFS